MLLVDADDQRTAVDFSCLRAQTQPTAPSYTCVPLTGQAVFTETQKLAANYDTIVIDTGGRDTASQRAAILVADLYLVPVVPRSFDVWTLDTVATLLREARQVNQTLQAYAFLNRADPRGSNNDEAARMIVDHPELEWLDAPVGHRMAFNNAASAGLAVSELRPRDPKAVDEIAILFKYVNDISRISPTKQKAA